MTRDAILQELSTEEVTTRRVLERVPTDKLGWKPHVKSKSAGELAWHIATIPWRAASMMQYSEVDVATIKAAPMPADSATIVAEFDRLLGEAKEMIGKLDDATLDQHTTLRRGDFTVFSGPRSQVLRRILLNHLYHHRGQLTVYLRLLDVSVPSVYGPTADER
jgi:uncharacterized damage-inducible protein DinB